MAIDPITPSNPQPYAATNTSQQSTVTTNSPVAAGLAGVSNQPPPEVNQLLNNSDKTTANADKVNTSAEPFNPPPGTTISMEKLNEHFYAIVYPEHLSNIHKHYETNPVFENFEIPINRLINKPKDQLINIDNKKNPITAEEAFKYCQLNGYTGVVEAFVDYEWGHESPAKRVKEYVLEQTNKYPDFKLQLLLAYVENGIGKISIINASMVKNKTTDTLSISYYLTAYKEDGTIDNTAPRGLSSLDDCKEMWLYETGKRIKL